MTDTANLLKNNQTAVTNAQNALASLKLQLSTSSNSTANQLASARLGLQSAELSYTSKTAPATASTIASDQASVTSAQESVRQAQIQVNGATLTAPADGTVAAVSVVAGLLAPSGNAITLEVGPMQVTASFAESAIGSIKVGQPTAVTVSAVGQTIDGTVSQITPTAATAAGGSSVVTYAVQITLTNAPATVLSGMSASIAVTTAEASNVIAVPAIALEGSSGNYSVRVIAADGILPARAGPGGPRDHEPGRDPERRVRGRHGRDRDGLGADQHDHGHHGRRRRDPRDRRRRWRVHSRRRVRRAMTDTIIALEGVSRVYTSGRLSVPALVSVNLQINRGEFVAIIGPSGSGKSTMMNILGCLDRPTEGRYILDGTPVDTLDDDGLAALRSRSIGFVFQSYNLLPRTSALDNVATPLMYQGVPRRERHARAQAVLERLGLGDRLNHEPTELSGGQQQRVGIARALVTEPAILLADEPTGNLDSHSGAEVIELFHDLHASGRTIILITHDAEVAAVAERQVHIRDGQVAA